MIDTLSSEQLDIAFLSQCSYGLIQVRSHMIILHKKVKNKLIPS